MMLAVCVCVCVCMCVCVCACAHLHAHRHVSCDQYVFVCVCICVRIYTCVCVCMHVFTYKHDHRCLPSTAVGVGGGYDTDGSVRTSNLSNHSSYRNYHFRHCEDGYSLGLGFHKFTCVCFWRCTCARLWLFL